MSAFGSPEHYQGYGIASRDELEQLRKALTAGSDINAPAVTPGEGFPLRTESLEATLKNVTFEMNEIKLFKTIDKLPATNTVEEFNRLLSYSEGGASQYDLGFMDEGALPEEEDSTYERAYVPIKFIGTVGRVTHVANTIRAAHGDVINTETMNKTMFMLQQLERALYFGDSSILPQQFDGLEKLITDGAPANVIDLRGAPLSEEKLNDGLLQIRDNFGLATDLYAATGPFADFSKQVYDRQRAQFGAAQPGVLGTKITEFQGQHGTINLHDHIFLGEGRTPPPSGLKDPAKRPLTPTILVQPANNAVSNPLFTAADAGTYFYRVVAANKHGYSAPVDTSGVTVSAGDNVTLTVQDNGQGTQYYIIYRTEPGGAVSTAVAITRVARTGSSQVITDLNADLPNTTKSFLLQQNNRSFSWAQLLPMTRIPLAVIDTSIRWAQVLYGAIKMYTPGKNIVYKNVGRLAA